MDNYLTEQNKKGNISLEEINKILDEVTKLINF